MSNIMPSQLCFLSNFPPISPSFTKQIKLILPSSFPPYPFYPSTFPSYQTQIERKKQNIKGLGPKDTISY